MRNIKSYQDFQKYHSGINKKPISSVNQLHKGEFLAFWSMERGEQVIAEIKDSDNWGEYFIVSPVEGDGWDRIKIRVTEFVCYAIHGTEYIDNRGCECGAKHTSFPNIHLFYCKLYRRECS